MCYRPHGWWWWHGGVSALSNVCDRESLTRSLRYFARVVLVSLEDGELSVVSRRESHRVDLLSDHVSWRSRWVSTMRVKESNGVVWYKISLISMICALVSMWPKGKMWLKRGKQVKQSPVGPALRSRLPQCPTDQWCWCWRVSSRWEVEWRPNGSHGCALHRCCPQQCPFASRVGWCPAMCLRGLLPWFPKLGHKVVVVWSRDPGVPSAWGSLPSSARLGCDRWWW